MTMPGFEIVKLLFGGLTYPLEETIEVKEKSSLSIGLENFPLKDSVEDIPLLYGTTAGTFVGLGEDASNKLVTAGPSGNQTLTFDSDTDEMFVATWSDGNDGESYLVKAINFRTDNSIDKVDLKYSINGISTAGTFQDNVKAGDSFSQGNVEIFVYVVDNSANTVLLGNNSANTNFHTLYSKEGMKVFLP